MKRILLSAVIAIASTGFAAADTDQGIQAFKQADYAAALEALRPESRAGDPRAMYVLGKMYGAGLGVEKDLAKAADYYKRAGEAGLVDAQHDYGVALALGNGVEQDIAEALKWLMIASLDGHKPSQAYASRLTKYMSRTRVLQARRAAYDWRAARDGEKPAEKVLGKPAK